MSTPETVQTVQEPTDETVGPFKEVNSKRGRVELAKDEDGQWHWCLWSSNGNQLAINAIPYPRLNDAKVGFNAAARAINSVQGFVIVHKD